MAINTHCGYILHSLPLCLFLLSASCHNRVLLHVRVLERSIHDTKRTKDLGYKRRCYYGNHPSIVEDGKDRSGHGDWILFRVDTVRRGVVLLSFRFRRRRTDSGRRYSVHVRQDVHIL